MSERFRKLLAELDRAGLEPMPVEFAEMLWLAAHISPTPRPVSANLTKPESPAFEKLTPPSEPEPLDDQTAQDSPSTPPRELPKSDQAALYPSSSTTGGQLSARPIRSPAVPSLPNALGLGRALRPLNRKIASRTRRCLNEEATAERLAEQVLAGPTLWIPALEPARERWFELALVIDRGDSMRVWQPLLADLRRLLGYHGAFRMVRIWHLETHSGKALLRVGADPDYARLCKPQELKAMAGRRLVLVVSDCISRAWHTGSVGELLEPLCAATPLAVLQMLPQRMWRVTALGRGTETRLSAAEPGAVAARLPVADINRLGLESLEMPPKSWRLPVLTLEADVLLAWANLLNGRQKVWINAVRFDAQTRYAVGDNPPPAAPTAEGINKRLDRFFADASPPAQELAGYLAATPLTLPVMRLVQQVMLPQPRQTELAEIFVSGLLRKEGDGGELYDFHEGVRERLLEAVGNSEAVKVLRLVSDFVASRAGRALDFHALLADPTADGDFALEEDARYFARVGAKVLRRLGGEYLKLAERLEGKQSKADSIHTKDDRHCVSASEDGVVGIRDIQELVKPTNETGDKAQAQPTSPPNEADELLPQKNNSPIINYDDENCEFYVDNYHNGRHQESYGIANWYDFIIRVLTKDGEVLNAGMWVSSDQEGLGQESGRDKCRYEHFLNGTKEKDDYWSIRYLYHSHWYRYQASGGYIHHIKEFAFFIDIKRPNGDIVRLWQSRRGKNYTLSNIQEIFEKKRNCTK